jgi:hypothetical protein
MVQNFAEIWQKIVRFQKNSRLKKICQTNVFFYLSNDKNDNFWWKNVLVLQNARKYVNIRIFVINYCRVGRNQEKDAFWRMLIGGGNEDSQSPYFGLFW